MSDATEKTVVVNRDIQAAKKQEAAELRAELGNRGTLVVNLVSSPGSGKTTLLEATARYWNGEQRMAVLVGDIATDRDAQRLAPWVPVEQLTTGGACHLEIALVKQGLTKLPTDEIDFLFIENIGNLVCPASHDLAEHLRVVLVSTTEGDDKPGKYPKMFRTSQALIVTKIDLLPYVPFSVSRVVDDAKMIQGVLSVFEVCALHGQGIEAWCHWLLEQRSRILNQHVFDPCHS